REPAAGWRRLAIVRRKRMQEVALIRPGRTAETELALESEKSALRREFEERLEDCGTLAYRVARGVVHNAADAEDVAQEALLLASIDGHSLEEVAELLQVPVGTVKSRLHSARKRLAEKLR